MKKHQFKPVPSQVSFPALEEEILKYWDEQDIFKKSVQQNKKSGKKFVFFEGPPTANGKPGSHHVEARVFKDLMPRYKTMRGFFSERKSGWDCHGLPVEIEVEKKLGISGKRQIEEFGIEKFNNLCRESVYEYIDDWEKVTKRIGFWVDMENGYETMSNTFIETGWWILKTLWDKSLLYEDYKVVPYCPRCGTPLSSHELAQGYKDDIADMSVFVKFKLTEESKKKLRESIITGNNLAGKHKLSEFSSLDFNFVAWTTTPWTLPGNVALAVDPNEDYGIYLIDNKTVVIGASKIFGNWVKVEISEEADKVAQVKGAELINLSYEPLFDFIKYDKRAHFIVPADFVSMEEGTGIVHTAVMYGEDDFKLGQKFDLPKKHSVNERGEFVPEVTPWAGMFVKKADPKIIEMLDEKKLLFKKEEIRHTYPFCWRCGTPLLYYAMTSWYLKTTEVKDKLLENNESVNWTPTHIKDGRMGEWLKNNKDWALSRSRYWGTPLPIWKCNKCSEKAIVGSVKELEELSGKNLSTLDLHRPYIDEIKWGCDCGGNFEREVFVLDCWFDSGSMPFAQWHYPFENKEKFQEHFPADYICEAMDQTRGWFYTLQATSTLLGNKSPYKNVICLGLALDEKGNKMSKSKGNVVAPMDVVNEAGADAMRWYFYSIVTPGESFRFSANLVKEINRRFLLILWNSYSFFVTYANLDNWSNPDNAFKSEKILDHWILVRLNQVIEVVTTKLDTYDVYSSTSEIEKFVNDLSTWYIRRSRDRVGPTATNKQSKEAFYQTSYRVFTTLTRLMAPFTPFVAEEIYRNLTNDVSVHLSSWPLANPAYKDENILANMNLAKDISALLHGFRKTHDIAVKIPLLSMGYFADYKLPEKFVELIKFEANIEGLVYRGKPQPSELKVAVDGSPELTNQNVEKGKARDLVRKIQEARKLSGTTMNEEVVVVLPDWPAEFEDYIKKETLSKELRKGETLEILRANP